MAFNVQRSEPGALWDVRHCERGQRRRALQAWRREGKLLEQPAKGTMTDKPATGEPIRVEVTARFLSDTDARQRAYEARRRLWTAAFHPSEPRAQAATRSRGRGAIHDPRQGKFEL